MNLPNKDNPELKLKKNVKLDVRDLFISNFVEEFYDSFPYFYYNGSLTSPQCDENVKWIVSMDLVPLGESIVKMFEYRLSRNDPKFIGVNRIPQKKHKRKVLVFDNKLSECGRPMRYKKDPYEGHFEKVKTKTKNYFYVDGNDSSGVKGAMELTDAEDMFIRSRMDHLD